MPARPGCFIADIPATIPDYIRIPQLSNELLRGKSFHDYSLPPDHFFLSFSFFFLFYALNSNPEERKRLSWDHHRNMMLSLRASINFVEWGEHATAHSAWSLTTAVFFALRLIKHQLSGVERTRYSTQCLEFDYSGVF